MEKRDLIVEKVMNNKRLRDKCLKDFGYEVKNYSDDDLAYIMYAITEQGGLKDQVKASKALAVVDQLAKFACSNTDSTIMGNYTIDTLKYFEVIK